MVQEPVSILLVEDDEVDVMNIKRAFKRKNISMPLRVARNGLDALEVLRANSQNSENALSERRLVLLDLNMPRMSGLEFLEAIRQDPGLQDTPVVVLTTSNDDNDRRQAYQYNVAGYLIKSVAFSDFADSIEALTQYWSLCKMP